MRRRLSLVGLVVLASTLGCFRAPPPPQVRPVKLAVVVVFDQLRGDYLERWRPLFVPDGFKRLMNEGAWFANCHYPYANTVTGAGHASILTGTSPYRHGIVANEWYQDGADAYCASTPRYDFVPPKKVDPPKLEVPKLEDVAKAIKKKTYAGNPTRMLSPTVADSLKEATGGRAKIYGLSMKDRSAVLPLGFSGGEAYWFENRFVTSTYYRETLPKWVQEFNASGTADRWFDQIWDRSRPDVDYVRYAGPDDVEGEGSPRTFPHAMSNGEKKPGSKYHNAVYTSPFGNDLLAEFTKTCVNVEKLGTHPDADLLVVSFSSNDAVGHAWGPDSQEVLDITLRSDVLMADLLKFLDAKVGPGNYSVVLTADHGVCPLPEVAAAKGLDAKRVAPAVLVRGAETFLQAAFGKAAEGEPEAGKALQWLEAVDPPFVYLNTRLIEAKKLDRETVSKALADWLLTQDGIARTFTRGQLGGDVPATDEIGQMVKRGFRPDRCGDVVVVLKPYHFYSTGTGTTHGSPYPYDTHVPLLAYGPGIPGGRRTELVTPQHAAPITAALLGIAPPKDCDYKLPETLYRW